MNVFFFCLSAGLHYLVLDQNLITLKEHLKLELVLDRMFKDTSVEEFIMSVDDKEQRVERFTEWLQSQPPKQCHKFVEILYKTDQSQVAVQLMKSCEYHKTCIWHLIYQIMDTPNIF